MKARAKTNWSLKTKLELPVAFLACLFFFLAGLLGSSLVSQDSSLARPRSRILESVKDKYDLMPHGDSGDDSLTTIPFQILSWIPRALYFPNFATAEQCKRIINMAEPSLKPSTLALREGETEDNTKGIRTSSGMFISASEDQTGTLDDIEEKIARATMLPRIHGEAFNVLRYEVGQRYHSHYDAFNPEEYGPQKSQRVASFLLYLSDVEEGGETVFPFENGMNLDGSYEYRQCTGLKVKPRRGDALLFYSLLPNGTIDPTSLHGSCPVIKGQKWVVTKWIRDQEQYD
ncbi:probable prolyl 4-hydroxylase 9 isoform X2 [Mangifera indica]|uniref:probable prolyl 4-hydroxylase 9 isoform X2 n=1 Tax=Mangifera indica TaxID=29780 RepID=UPI001CFA2EEE|nr:probable prolyl 4-hydroxylase 9 isoform X2 [Mangifera indica]